MSITIRALIELTTQRYHLKQLAGEDELDHMVTWVHLLDHPSIAEFFWGNEMAVTSGYDLHCAEDIRCFIDTLAEHHGAGLIINVGKYVQTVPDEITAYCAEIGFPLFTMPWEVSLTEFVRECCFHIGQSDRQEEQLAQTVLRVIRNPREAEARRGELDPFFSEEDGFTLLTVRMDPVEGWREIAGHLRALRVHTALRPFGFPYLQIREENQLHVLINRQDEQVSREAAESMIRTIRITFGAVPVHVGIGEAVRGYAGLADGYHSAQSAVRRAELQNMEIVCFREMGFYKLLYSVPNDDLLRGYYQEVMGRILEYDRETDSEYAETLFRYVLSDGSLRAVAEQMHTHRNTIYYRMGKIRALLNNELEGQQERLPFLLAYHIGVMLRLMPELV